MIVTRTPFRVSLGGGGTDLPSYYSRYGGFIVSDYNDAEAIGVTLDRRVVMFEAFAEKAGYPNYREIIAAVGTGRTGHSWGRQAME